MGCSGTKGEQHPMIWQTGQSFVMLVMEDKTSAIIYKINKLGSLFNPNAALNFKGDTLLHYACARENKSLVEYLISHKETIRSLKNKLDEKPHELVGKLKRNLKQVEKGSSQQKEKKKIQQEIIDMCK